MKNNLLPDLDYGALQAGLREQTSAKRTVEAAMETDEDKKALLTVLASLESKGLTAEASELQSIIELMKEGDGS